MTLWAAVRPAGLCLLLLAACATQPSITAVPPLPRPSQPEEPEEQPSQADIRMARAERNRAANDAAHRAASAPDEELRRYYQGMEASLLSHGRLRRDRVPQDAPIDVDSLTRDFIQIALHDEYSRSGERLVADSPSAPLRRWKDPVRLQLSFGDSADQALQRIYRGQVAAFSTRLQQATGHPVSLTASKGNFHILVLSEAERRDISSYLATTVPDLPAADVATLSQLDRDNLCTVFAYSRGDQQYYVRAVAIMRAELPSLLRSSCIHEELAQGLGLANDSPSARPSIFNDDEEFALLTRHDELLLQILYDPRLRPGMTAAEATPIVRSIATELLDGN
ncbi:DUF2927 domain-containing protein [Paracoccus seriniphilus]|uniref:DUF2927 domain-containing protein n=1 Tax=Paracoccus seriniphilus TaxID=184748 RepID=A0A239PMC6_9RHOB|nr:DUF2927 domain-containing protein [Paracoccus seriniphilus]WCR13496.1 DUF2927 domain-containing protein [Paracoccus seriniphilus]SNT68926.1 Protein of unknown function [Paracoccus seriniphilus]